MAYKIIDLELEVIVEDWPVDWCKILSAKEISIRPLVDAPDEKFQAWKYLNDFDGESSTKSNPKSWRMLEELHTKICMDFNIDNNSHSMMEN